MGFIAFSILPWIEGREIGSSGNPYAQNRTSRDSIFRSDLENFTVLLAPGRLGSDETRRAYLELIELFRVSKIEDLLILSDYYYLTGAYNQNVLLDLDAAIDLFEKSQVIRKQVGLLDLRYSRACNNLCILYMNIGDLVSSIDAGNEALESREQLYGSDSKELISPLINITAANIAALRYGEALAYALRGIELVKLNPSDDPDQFVKLHLNAGIAYQSFQDYSTAIQYLTVARDLLRNSGDVSIDLLVSANNGLAVCYRLMDDAEKASESYRGSIDLIESGKYGNSNTSTIYVNYGFFLANTGAVDEAEAQIRKGVSYSEKNWGDTSRIYVSDIENMAYFQSEYKNDYESAEQNFRICFDYISRNPFDKIFEQTVKLDYSRMLSGRGERDEALTMLNILLEDKALLRPQDLIRALRLRSDILYQEFSSTNDLGFLIKSFESLADAVSVIEDSRLEIKAEESRLMVTGHFESIYDDCLDKLARLYGETDDSKYIDLAFGYSEKSKAATLLASTRAASAIKYHIPDDLAQMESELKSKTRLYTELIFREQEKKSRNDSIMSAYEMIRLQATRSLDSLVRVFEGDYPDYYSLTHSSSMADFRKIRHSIGGQENFIEYYYNDTTIYIFLTNRRVSKMIRKPVDEQFRNDLVSFRNAVLNPAISEGAREQFDLFVDLGRKLYQVLLDPVMPFIVSDKLVIVPDNMLYYIPFESFLTDTLATISLNYRSLPFAFKSFDLKYAYSGSLLMESRKSGRNLENRALVFAPDYNGEISSDSIMLSRQTIWGGLTNIPGAKEEAIYINSLLGGTIFLDSVATESSFKNESENFSVIHLAMHTLVNNKDPMYSKMVFALDNNTIENGSLNTYEVYDLKLNAKMVFLSSCNTGTGYLQSGEGVMSLARGFFYSGAPSVIMSLWEVDDRSGTDIVKSFYKKLKNGKSKSRALRQARVRYLKEADQMRSHPYFWSTLVIMGNDSAIFFPVFKWFVIVLSVIVISYSGWRYYKTRSP